MEQLWQNMVNYFLLDSAASLVSLLEIYKKMLKENWRFKYIHSSENDRVMLDQRYERAG